MSIAIGTRLGTYEIVARLGAGGMGEVYRIVGEESFARWQQLEIVPRHRDDYPTLADLDRVGARGRIAVLSLAAVITPDTLDVWEDARDAAREFWARGCDDARLSDDGRSFCESNAQLLANKEPP